MAKRLLRRRPKPDDHSGRTLKQIGKLPGKGITPDERRRLHRFLDKEFARQAEIIAEAFKRVSEKDKAIVLDGAVISNEESEGLIIYGDERDKPTTRRKKKKKR